MNINIYWSTFEIMDWNFYLAATSKGVCYVGSPNQPIDEMTDWVKKKFPKSTLVEDREKLAPYVAEITEYIEGKRTSFEVSMDACGTEFQKAVWQAVCEIPYGETRTYSDIANAIENPKAVRAVGAAIGANPILMSIPCHRVVGKNGSLIGFRAGLDMKQRLLKLEKVWK